MHASQPSPRESWSVDSSMMVVYISKGFLNVSKYEWLPVGKVTTPIWKINNHSRWKWSISKVKEQQSWKPSVENHNMMDPHPRLGKVRLVSKPRAVSFCHNAKYYQRWFNTIGITLGFLWNIINRAERNIGLQADFERIFLGWSILHEPHTISKSLHQD